MLLVGGLAWWVLPRGAVLVVAEAACALALARLWVLSVGGPLVQPLYEPLPGVELSLRIDRLGLFFGLLAIGSGLVLTLPWLMRPLAPRPRLFAWVLVAQAAALEAMLAGGLEAVAAGWALAVWAVLAVAIGAGRPRFPGATTAFVALLASALLLISGAGAVNTAAGTGSFESMPVGAIDVRSYLLLAGAPVLVIIASGALVRVIRSLLPAMLALATVLVPMSGYVLARLYDLGGGRVPSEGVGNALVLLGGVVALWLSASSLWAPDLGAAALRLAQAAAALLLVAAGVGTPSGYMALLIGCVTVCVGVPALLSLVDAGQGRLLSSPGSGPRAVAERALALVLLLWAGGLPIGLAFHMRSLLAKGALDSPPPTLVLALVALASLPVQAVAAYSLTRFGGGTRVPGDGGPGRERTGRVILLLLTLMVLTALAGPLVDRIVVPLAAGALRVSTLEVAGQARTAPPGLLGETVVAAALILLSLWASLRRGWPAPDSALPGAIEMLPPRLAVAPRVGVLRQAPRMRRRLRAAANLALRRPGWVAVGLWTAAAGAALALLR